MCAAQTIVPDGRCELIINFAQPFQNHRDGRWHIQPDCFFVGQIIGPFLLRPAGPAKVIGVRFHAYGASRLLALPIFELTDSIVSVDAISPSLHRELERMRELRSTPEQIALLDLIMRTRAELIGSDDPLVSFAVNEFERTAGLINISGLANRVGLSTRQFERRFRTEVGIGPKLFGRVQRFQRVFRAFEDARPNWVDVAVDCGYYDQSHLIRDFREFSGNTPTALLANEFDLTRHFLQSGSVSHFSNTFAR